MINVRLALYASSSSSILTLHDDKLAFRLNQERQFPVMD